MKSLKKILLLCLCYSLTFMAYDVCSYKISEATEKAFHKAWKLVEKDQHRRVVSGFNQYVMAQKCKIDAKNKTEQDTRFAKFPFSSHEEFIQHFEQQDQPLAVLIEKILRDYDFNYTERLVVNATLDYQTGFIMDCHFVCQPDDSIFLKECVLKEAGDVRL